MASNDANVGKLSGAGIFTRYRSMIVLIIVFLTIMASVMIGTLIVSMQLRRISQEHAIVQSVNASVQGVFQNLLNLRLNYGEDPNSPYSKHLINELAADHARVQNGFKVLLEGGEFTFNDGEKVLSVPLSADIGDAHNNIERMRKSAELWRPWGEDTEAYMKVALSPTATSVALDMAVLRGRGVIGQLTENIEEVVRGLRDTEAVYTSILGWLQTIGVIGSLLFFILFVFYALRKLYQSDAAAEFARRETSEIMNTVSTGLFLLDHDLNIGSQYSKELENLLGQKDIGNKNLIDVLGGMISDEELNNTHGFIGQLYNPRTKERLIGSLNPLSRQPVTVTSGDKTSVRYLDFKFNRVYHGNEISRVLVNVSDVTDAVNLEKRIEQEREQNDVQLEMLSTILRTDRRMIDDFVRNIKRRNTNINNTLKSPGERQSDLRNKIEVIFREVHSLKGEASTLKLHGFTVMAESVENELHKLSQVSPLSGENFLSLAVHLDELMKLTQTIEDLVNRLSSKKMNSSAQSSAQVSSAVAGYYSQFVAELAERNNKKVDFTYSGIEETQNEALDVAIREVAVQLLRNAVVHGIETPEQRDARHKLTTGHVRMALTDTGSGYNLVLEDDGAGIDYEAIRDKAVRLGRVSKEKAASLTSKDLIGMIFSSGFSTLDKSTEDAGRGVGLDIIKDRVVSLGGKIGLVTHAGAFTRFIFTFPKK